METILKCSTIKSEEIHEQVENLDKVSSSNGFDINCTDDQDYRVPKDDSSSFSDSDSSISISSSSENGEEDSSKKKASEVKNNTFRTKGELSLDDLPKIEELNISVAETEIKAIGKISGIVDREVIVASFKNSSPLDIDSILFLSNGKPIGRIFDVFGPVIEPLYSIRFNSVAEIQSKGFVINDIVYYAPENKETTSYVFVNALRKEKGSDASWADNNEPPLECIDYSDDEQEREARQKARAKNRNYKTDIVEMAKKKLANGINENSINYKDMPPQLFNKECLSVNQLHNNVKTSYGVSSQNISLNPMNSFHNPSHNMKLNKPLSTLTTVKTNRFSEKQWSTLATPQKFSFGTFSNSDRNFATTPTVNSARMLNVRNMTPVMRFQDPGNMSSLQLNSNSHMASSRVSSETSSEVLNETFQFKSMPRPPLLETPLTQQPTCSNIFSIPSNQNSKNPASIKMKNSMESRLPNINFEASNNMLSKQNFLPSSHHHNQSSQISHDLSLHQEDEMVLNKKYVSNLENSEINKNVIKSNEFPESSRQISHSLNMSTMPVTSNSFVQHMVNPIMIRSPPPSFFVSPYQNLNFCTPPPLNIPNHNGVQFRSPPNVTSPISSVSPLPRPWQPFHPPMFGILPAVANHGVLKVPPPMPFIQTQRPMTVQVMPGIVSPELSFASHRIPFYDPRQPPPRIFRSP